MGEFTEVLKKWILRKQGIGDVYYKREMEKRKKDQPVEVDETYAVLPKVHATVEGNSLWVCKEECHWSRFTNSELFFYMQQDMVYDLLQNRAVMVFYAYSKDYPENTLRMASLAHVFAGEKVNIRYNRKEPLYMVFTQMPKSFVIDMHLKGDEAFWEYGDGWFCAFDKSQADRLMEATVQELMEAKAQGDFWIEPAGDDMGIGIHCNPERFSVDEALSIVERTLAAYGVTLEVEKEELHTLNETREQIET